MKLLHLTMPALKNPEATAVIASASRSDVTRLVEVASAYGPATPDCSGSGAFLLVDRTEQ